MRNLKYITSNGTKINKQTNKTDVKMSHANNLTKRMNDSK